MGHHVPCLRHRSISGSDQPGTLVHSQKFTTSGSNDFYEIALNKTVEISGSENIWVVMTHYGAWQPAAGCADQGDPNGKDGDEYTVRVVYGGEIDSVHYAMSCPQNVIFNTNSISNNDINNIMIYPNPTDGNLNINVVGMKHISIVNTLGQVVYDNNIDSNNEIIDMSQYNSGVYVVRIETENGVVIRQVSVKK